MTMPKQVLSALVLPNQDLVLTNGTEFQQGTKVRRLHDLHVHLQVLKYNGDHAGLPEYQRLCLIVRKGMLLGSERHIPRSGADTC